MADVYVVDTHILIMARFDGAGILTKDRIILASGEIQPL
jgi:hypothetical protein